MPPTPSNFNSNLTYIECDCGQLFQVRQGQTDVVNMKATSQQALAHYKTCKEANRSKRDEVKQQWVSLKKNMEKTFKDKGWEE